MVNRRRFFATMCGLGTTSVLASISTTPDVPPPDDGGYHPLQLHKQGGTCSFQVDPQGRLWIRSNEGPYRRVVTE